MDKLNRCDYKNCVTYVERNVMKFFIDFQDGDALHEDDEGGEFLGLKQARKEAIGLLADIAKDELADSGYRNLTATVRDESGDLLYRANLMFHGEFLLT